jgi:hypothetical protein
MFLYLTFIDFVLLIVLLKSNAPSFSMAGQLGLFTNVKTS